MFQRLTKHKELIALALILLIAAFLRLYRIPEYMTFLGDEGRDARVVSRIITDFDPVLIGPMTSVTTTAGHMYLGPAYYYLMAPFMLITNLSPVGPAVMVVFFSLATITLLWWSARTWFHPTAGLIAALLYAISPVVIIYSRSSWNPNIMPFFALLAVWSLYKVWQTNARRWFITAAICTAVVLQSHYLGLLLLPVLGLLWLACGMKFWNFARSTQTPLLTKEGAGEVGRNQNQLSDSSSIPANPSQPPLSQGRSDRTFLRHSLIALAVFLFLMSPLLIFDMRHDWLNFNAFKAFFTERQTTVNLKFYKGFTDLYPMLVQIYGRLLTLEKNIISHILIGFTFLAMGVHSNSKSASTKNQPRQTFFTTLQPYITQNAGLLILLIWLITGLIGLTSYKQHVYDHYFGFLFPVPFLLTGWFLWQLFSPKGVFSCCMPLGKIWGLLILLWLILANLTQNPLNQSPNRQLQRTSEISQKIVDESGGQPFNLAMIAKSNYDEGYRFFLEKWHAQLVIIDPQNPATITEQLFVVCETDPCNPVGHSQSEIANFGWTQIDKQWDYPWGHKLFRLVHIAPEATVSAEPLP